MTSEILIETRDGRTAMVKPNSVTWKTDCGNYCDSCTIVLPLYPYLQTSEEGTEMISGESRCIFAVGGKVSVSLGYDGNNTKRFWGYVAIIDYDTTLILQCEGYFHQIKHKRYTKSWSSVSLKTFLRYITEGTSITLSNDIPDIPLGDVTLTDATADKIFSWLKSDFQLCIFFKGAELYAGAYAYGKEGDTHKLRIGWNVKTNNLKIQPQKTEVQVNLVVKDDGGKKTTTKGRQNGSDTVKNVNIKAGLPDYFKKAVLERLQQETNTGGRLEGSVTCFLTPTFNIGDVASIENTKYPERNGNFFVTAISGSYGSTGGTQQLTLKYYGR